MKKAFAVFLWLFLVGPVWAQENLKVGTVDIQKAISLSQAGKQARAKFQAEVKKVEDDIRSEREEAERLKSDYEKKGPLLKADERRRLEKEVQKRYVALQRKMRDSQEELRQREGEMTSKVLRELEKVVYELGQSEEFSLIFASSQLLYSDKSMDVTDKVIELYDRRTAGKATKGK